MYSFFLLIICTLYHTLDTQKSMKPLFGHPVSKYWLRLCILDYYTSRGDTLIPLVGIGWEPCVKVVGNLCLCRLLIRWMVTAVKETTYKHPLSRCRFMIPYIVEDVMLSRSPRVAKVCQGLSRMPPSTMKLSYCWEQHVRVSQFREKSKISTQLRW